MTPQARPADSAARLYVLAGCNGAGKSSLAGAAFRARGADYFNPDEAARRIRGRHPHLSLTQANSAAWQEGKRLLEQAIAKRLDHAFETTLGGSTYTALLEDAAQLGFEVRVWFAGLASPDLHLHRIAERVARGGHDIPAEDVRRRYDRARLNLIHLLPRLTELRVFDNSLNADLSADLGAGVAPRPALVLHTRRGEILAPADFAATPEWAKPIVAAALKGRVASRA
jgi:predicted ABC-type ATPase